MGSSGGGSYAAPKQQTPAGPIAPYGESTAFNPGFINVLPSSGWATPASIETAMNAGIQQQEVQRNALAQQMAAGRAAAQPIGLDAFAQQLMDWRKKNAVAMMGGGNPNARGNVALLRDMPQAQGAAQQLMRQGVQDSMMASLQKRQAAANAARARSR